MPPKLSTGGSGVSFSQDSAPKAGSRGGASASPPPPRRRGLAVLSQPTPASAQTRSLSRDPVRQPSTSSDSPDHRPRSQSAPRSSSQPSASTTISKSGVLRREGKGKSDDSGDVVITSVLPAPSRRATDSPIAAIASPKRRARLARSLKRQQQQQDRGAAASVPISRSLPDDSAPASSAPASAPTSATAAAAAATAPAPSVDAAAAAVAPSPSLATVTHPVLTASAVNRLARIREALGTFLDDGDEEEEGEKKDDLARFVFGSSMVDSGDSKASRPSLSGPPMNLVMQVLSVHRYIPTPHHFTAIGSTIPANLQHLLGLNPSGPLSGVSSVAGAGAGAGGGGMLDPVLRPPVADAYDLVLSDGECKTKVVVAYHLFPLIESGVIQFGSVLRVRNVVRRYVELPAFSQGFLVLENAEVILPTAPIYVRLPPAAAAVVAADATVKDAVASAPSRSSSSSSSSSSGSSISRLAPVMLEAYLPGELAALGHTHAIAQAAPIKWLSPEGSREQLHRPLIDRRSYYTSLYNGDGVEFPSSLAVKGESWPGGRDDLAGADSCVIAPAYTTAMALAAKQRMEEEEEKVETKDGGGRAGAGAGGAGAGGEEGKRVSLLMTPKGKGKVSNADARSPSTTSSSADGTSVPTATITTSSSSSTSTTTTMSTVFGGGDVPVAVQHELEDADYHNFSFSEEEWVEERDYQPLELVSIDQIRRRQLASNMLIGRDVVARVTAKSRVVNFDKPASFHSSPFFFELLIADNTGTLKVTVWNAHVRRYWRRVRVGDVIALRGLKLRYQSDCDLVEGSLNTSNPRGQLFLLDPRQIPGQDQYVKHMAWVLEATQQREAAIAQAQAQAAARAAAHVAAAEAEAEAAAAAAAAAKGASPPSKALAAKAAAAASALAALLSTPLVAVPPPVDPTFFSPHPSCCPLGPLAPAFVPIANLHTVPDGSLVDVAGLIVFAGRTERDCNPRTGQFSQHRWVRIADPVSPNVSLPVRLASYSRTAIISALQAGDLVVLTNISIISSRPFAVSDVDHFNKSLASLAAADRTPAAAAANLAANAAASPAGSPTMTDAANGSALSVMSTSSTSTPAATGAAAADTTTTNNITSSIGVVPAGGVIVFEGLGLPERSFIAVSTQFTEIIPDALWSITPLREVEDLAHIRNWAARVYGYTGVDSLITADEFKARARRSTAGPSRPFSVSYLPGCADLRSTSTWAVTHAEYRSLYASPSWTQLVSAVNKAAKLALYESWTCIAHAVVLNIVPTERGSLPWTVYDDVLFVPEDPAIQAYTEQSTAQQSSSEAVPGGPLSASVPPSPTLLSKKRPRGDAHSAPTSSAVPLSQSSSSSSSASSAGVGAGPASGVKRQRQPGPQAPDAEEMVTVPIGGSRSTSPSSSSASSSSAISPHSHNPIMNPCEPLAWILVGDLNRDMLCRVALTAGHLGHVAHTTPTSSSLLRRLFETLRDRKAGIAAYTAAQAAGASSAAGQEGGGGGGESGDAGDQEHKGEAAESAKKHKGRKAKAAATAAAAPAPTVSKDAKKPPELFEVPAFFALFSALVAENFFTDEAASLLLREYDVAVQAANTAVKAAALAKTQRQVPASAAAVDADPRKVGALVMARTLARILRQEPLAVAINMYRTQPPTSMIKQQQPLSSPQGGEEKSAVPSAASLSTSSSSPEPAFPTKESLLANLLPSPPLAPPSSYDSAASDRDLSGVTLAVSGVFAPLASTSSSSGGGGGGGGVAATIKRVGVWPSLVAAVDTRAKTAAAEAAKLGAAVAAKEQEMKTEIKKKDAAELPSTKPQSQSQLKAKARGEKKKERRASKPVAFTGRDAMSDASASSAKDKDKGTGKGTGKMVDAVTAVSSEQGEGGKVSKRRRRRTAVNPSSKAKNRLLRERRALEEALRASLLEANTNSSTSTSSTNASTKATTTTTAAAAAVKPSTSQRTISTSTTASGGLVRRPAVSASSSSSSSSSTSPASSSSKARGADVIVVDDAAAAARKKKRRKRLNLKKSRSNK